MKVVRFLLALGYPFVVLAGLKFLSARSLACLMAALFVGRWATGWKARSRESLLQLGVPAVLIGSILLATTLSNDDRVLLLTPACVNAALLYSFGRTLFRGPTFVETLARLQVPDLPPDEVRYCRSITVVWCVFFVLNAAASVWLALFSTRQTWALYTGFLAYLLMGVLFACEFGVRSWRFGRYEGTVVAPVFRRILPRLGGAAPRS